MKNKILSILMIVLLVGVVFALASCDMLNELMGNGPEDPNPENCEHDMEEVLDSLVNPTCTAEGRITGRCAICGYEETITIPAFNHEDKEITQRQDATCTEKGFVKYQCLICDEILTEELAIKAHTETAYPEVEANCSVTGYTGGKYCSVCDEVLEARTEIPASGEHNSVPYTEDDDVAPTCGTVGYTGGEYCSVCKEITVARTEIPAAGEHTPKSVPAVPATCHSTGLTEGSVCSVCETVLVEQTEVETIPHVYDYSITTPPAYQVDGLGTYDCRNCDATYTEAIPALTYSPEDIWDGTVATSFASGTGTSSDPYVIETAAQLAYLCHFNGSSNNYSQNIYYKLGNDIILNDISNYAEWNDSTAGLNQWTPIGGSYSKFLGHFDGAGFAIRGMYCTGNREYYGLFGQVRAEGEDASIKNLKVTEAYVSSMSASNATQSTGGIIQAAYADNWSYLTLSDLLFDGKIISKGNAAGILTWASAGGHRNLTSSNRDDSYGHITLINCTVDGKIISATSNAVNDVYVAGVMAYFLYDNGTLTMNNCVNNATISSRGNAAGVIGYVTATSTGAGEFNLVFLNCGNNGDVTASGSVGGFAYAIFLSDGWRENFSNALSISGCYNNGTVTKNPSGINGDVAGLAASISHWDKTQSVIVTGCYNTGDVVVLPKPEGSSSSVYTASSVAGLIARLNLDPYYINSTYYPTYFTNCFNSGNVTATDAYQVGGLCAYMYCENALVDSCYNSGNVTGMGECSYVGGIAAYVSEAELKNVYNVGNITGISNVGGLVGHAYGQDLKIHYSYNAGTVSGSTETSNYIGAIVGNLDGYENFVSVYYALPAARARFRVLWVTQTLSTQTLTATAFRKATHLTRALTETLTLAAYGTLPPPLTRPILLLRT